MARGCKTPLNCVKSIIAGSQGFDKNDLDAVKAVLPNAEMTLYYGASELNYITYIKDSEMTGDRTLIGRPFKGVGVSVRDGEIYIDTKFHGCRRKMPGQRLATAGSIDENGMLHFLGRRDDMYNINGIKVSGLKVESRAA